MAEQQTQVVIPEGKTVVLTSENSAAFYARKLDLEPPAPVVAAEVKVEPAKAEEVAAVIEAEPAIVEGETDAQRQEREKKRGKLNLRFSELTGERDAAKADAQRERDARIAAETEAAELKKKLAPPAEKPAPVEDAAAPKPNDFPDAFKYAEALAEYSAKKALAERDKTEREAKAKTAREEIVKTWQSRQAEFRKATPDYEATINAATVQVSNEVMEAILDSSVGPALLYHLGLPENAEYAERLGKLTVGGALRELGKLEAKFEKAPEAKSDAATVAKSEISKAPAPITPLNGSGAAPDVPINSKGEYTGSYADWKRLRKAGKIH